MQITFHGAAGGFVTGSCHRMSINGQDYLVDCGMFQGSKKAEDLNWKGFDFDVTRIKYLFLTHAHLDHVGRLPLLVKAGFKGTIISTDATRDLTRLVLLDAAKLHKEAVKHGRVKVNGQKVDTPLFTTEDVEKVMELFKPHEYGNVYNLDANILRFRLREAGHILGSAIFEFWVKDDGQAEKKLVFSGDLGQRGARIIRDPDYIRTADYVMVETTYGGRLHKDKASTVLEFLEILNDVQKHQTIAMVPVFALERSQEILYELNLLFERKILSPSMRVYLDSPMAIEATRIFEKYRKYYDEDAQALIRDNDEIFRFNGLIFTEKVEQSKKIKDAKNAVILAGSGMMTGGRILHHLINFGPNPDAHIIFVGYQVPGTLGRMLVDGKRRVKIYGKTVNIRAKIHTLGGFSAHADQFDLLYWLRGFGRSVKKVFLIHGEDDQRQVFATKVISDLGLPVEMPKLGETVEI